MLPAVAWEQMARLGQAELEGIGFVIYSDNEVKMFLWMKVTEYN